MEEYKINIHAHSIFSDGINSPLAMAMKAKSLGFSALVITDHFYGRKIPEFMSVNTMRLLKKACQEAREILPVIIGLEVPFMGQEVLIFGGAAIKSILENGKPTYDELARLKKETGCAVVLCHPGELDPDWVDIVDGFEHYNSGHDFFKKRGFGNLEGKQRWCNSDAHTNACLETGYNIVDTKIENESDLIRYIKRGKQHKFFIQKSLNED